MREQLIQYVNLLFAGSPDNEEMKQEILQNTLDRYDDLVSQGKAPEAAYRLAISGIGDINELLSSRDSAVASPLQPSLADNIQPVAQSSSEKKKLMRAVAIGMYICCVVPVLILGNIGLGPLGVCMMFLLIAAATVLIIMAADEKAGKKGTQAEEDRDASNQKLSKPLQDALNAISVAIFLILSLVTGAWYITWLVFPIMSAVKALINAVMDLKEADKV